MEYQLDLSKYKNSSIGTSVDSDGSKVKSNYKYSGIAWFFVTWFGTTRLPYEISFTCVETKEVFEILTEKDLIEHYMLYRKK
jgi:hypothetical protein